MTDIQKLLRDHQDLIDAYVKSWLDEQARRSNEFWRRKGLRERIGRQG